ncbi:Transmembrane exosortase (Exosortase_EpsH) [Posidoniimonas corsicana]|uniref:Transmembrane exosortase (Exosortase_EpsH) n=1 Tax=Posidoniimonas corsicana TaxID=1938618 RepID=A0A5C5VE76_9BACT|nr:exosortase U [Posidoniimonas corsicana]TWT35965.1 Transmembrane exosortase (Exosortase_EpsH) [Posidoniimonas corsicana]
MPSTFASTNAEFHVGRKPLFIAAAAAIALGVLPLFAAELSVLASRDMYTYFPFIYAFIGFVAWQRWQAAEGTIGPRASRSWWPELLCLSGALGVLLLHAGLFGPWLGGAAATLTLAAAAFVVRRVRAVQFWDLWALFLVTQRMPLEADRKLAAALQQRSSGLSSLMLDSLGVLHVRAGNIIELPGKPLFVDEACSGVVSTMSVIAAAAVLAVWRQRPLLHTLLLIACSVGWALLMNASRITAIAAMYSWHGIDLTAGPQHELVGLAAFAVLMLCLWSTDLALAALAARIDGWQEEGFSLERGRVARFYNRAVSFLLFPQPDRDARLLDRPAVRPVPALRLGTLAVCFAAVGLLHGYALYANYRASTLDRSGVVARLLDLDESRVDAAVAPWRVTKHELQERNTISELAPLSMVYYLTDAGGDHTAILSIDFPFHRRWHNVCGCYTNSGWRQTSEANHALASDVPVEGGGYVTADLESERGTYGRVAFANYFEDGRLIAPPAHLPSLGYAVDTLIHKWRHARQLSLRPQKLIQIQVFAEQEQPFTESQQQELSELLESSSHMLESFLLGQNTPEMLPESSKQLSDSGHAGSGTLQE